MGAARKVCHTYDRATKYPEQSSGGIGIPAVAHITHWRSPVGWWA